LIDQRDSDGPWESPSAPHSATDGYARGGGEESSDDESGVKYERDASLSPIVAEVAEGVVVDTEPWREGYCRGDEGVSYPRRNQAVETGPHRRSNLSRLKNRF
jgi:hypothetical protein